MGQSLAIPRVIPDNWKRLDLIVNKIKLHLGSAASPTYVGLTLTGLTASTLIGANASKALESVTVGTGLDYTRPNLTLSHLGIEDLTDPGGDRIFFWDNSASASKWLTCGNSIAITLTTLDTIQDIRTTATPTFNGLISTGVVRATDFAKTGWPIVTGATFSFNNADKVFTVTDGGSAYYYIDGVKYTLGGNKTVDLDDIGLAEGLWYIYFDGATLTASQVIWSFRAEDKALVAILYWDNTNNKEIFLGWEAHTFHMDGSTHARLHYAGGARWETGLLVSDNGDDTVDISAGDIWDEDLNIPITDDDTPTALFEQILSPARLPIYYRDGASAWRIYEIGEKAAVTDVGYLSGGNLKWNDATTTWSNETVGGNNYVAYYVVATNEQSEPVALIMGQRVDNKLSDAKENNVFSGLALTGLPFQEMVVLARLILKDDAAYTLEEVLDLRVYNIKGNITSPLIPDHGGLAGLGDDDHPQYIKDSEFTQDSGILVGTGNGTFQEETGATLRTSIGVGTTDDVTLQSLFIDQETDAVGINIDSEATTLANYGLQCVTGQGACAAYFAYGDAANGVMYVGLAPNSGYQGTVAINRNLTAASTDCGLLYLYDVHVGDDQPCLDIDQRGVGKGIGIITAPLDTTNAAQYGIHVQTLPAKTAAAMTNRNTGIYSEVQLKDTNTQNWSQALAGLVGFHAHITTHDSSSGTVTGSIGLLATSTFTDSATITFYAGVYVETPSVTNNKLTNAYGLYIDNINTAQTLNYAIYTNAGLIRFGGAVEAVTTFESTGIATLADGSLLKTSAAPTTDPMIANKKYVDDEIATGIGAGGHNHNTDTLQLDAINSDGGAFSFTTSGAVTFSQDLILSGTETYGIDLSSGTWASAALNLDADCNIFASGTQAIAFDANNTLIGKGSGGSLTTGDENVFFGYLSGGNQTDNSNILIIDNQNRASAANEITNCMMYGVFGGTPSAQSLRINAKIIAGLFAAPMDVGSGYGIELHYSGDDTSVTGIRSRVQLVTTDAPTRTALGGLFQAANNDNINANVLMGFMAEAIGKSTSNASTITTMRGGLIGTEWGALDTITNLKTLHIRGHSLNTAGAGSFGTGYALYIENEAVGGNGQAYDAGIYFKGTNLSAGNKAFTYGVDFSGATYGTADIKLSSGGLIGGPSGHFDVDTSGYAIINSADLSESVEIYHTNSDARINWSKGDLYFECTEADATNQVIFRGTGTGYTQFRTYDQDRAEYLTFYCGGGQGVVRTGGVAPGVLTLQSTAHAGIWCFHSCTEGETEEFQIYGYGSGFGGQESLDISVEQYSANTADFYGLLAYHFDGDLESDGLTLSDLTAGSVPFIGTAGLISQDNSDFFWNNTSKCLGIGTATPESPAYTRRTVEVADASAPSFTLNDTGQAEKYGFMAIGARSQIMYGSTVLVVFEGAGNVGINKDSPTAQLHVDQSSASGAKPVLRLDQGDVDDSFIDFIGTSAADGTRSISSDVTENSAKFGAIRVEINGVTKWIRIYDDES